ncbi:hypothetical protein ACFFGH_29995 [Lysobacter korlensis]|uniref:Uncharacterized protein n=1 Tax=Lysobacter korlensis TaxID=553636 RepID=A0ABV6RYM7_9GAMM
MSAGEESDRQGSTDGLLDRIRLIEDQPLDSRAGAYASLHDELRRVLEGGDRPAP